MSYNGWTNYETWAAALWIDNEEGSQSYFSDLAREALADHGDPDDEHDRQPVWQLRETLKDEIQEMAPDLGASLFSDLLGAAIESIDWTQLAEHYIETARDEAV